MKIKEGGRKRPSFTTTLGHQKQDQPGHSNQHLATDNQAILGARDYLLRRQYPDGSWLAESHVEFKAQKYFENGDPFGEHQFLSTAATAWATAGLAQLLPSKPAQHSP